MSKTLRVTPSIALAGFPVGEVREVESTAFVSALLADGRLVETDLPVSNAPEAVEAPAPVPVPAAPAKGAVAAPGPPVEPS